MSWRKPLRRLTGPAIVTLGLAAALSCGAPPPNGEAGELPDSKSFVNGGVSKFMEVRCGGLDCHGQDGRPLRIYSEWGLRFQVADAGRVQGPTTASERLENYRSVVSLEPEALSECFRTQGATFRFQLLQKPLGIENDGIRHKGGPILRPAITDPGWACLFGWASGKVNAEDCENASRIQ